MKKEQIELFLKELNDSADRINDIFTDGSCTRLFKILKVICPNAELYWSDSDAHGITKIDDDYYDIGGLINKEYVKLREYHLVPESHYKGYFILKYTEVDIKRHVKVDKYFK